MAANLKSKTARAKLVPQREPYWERLSLGVHIGYRKAVGTGGTWIGRRKGEDGRYQFHSHGGDAVLEYDDARRAVIVWNEELTSGVLHARKELTVAEVCRRYVDNRRVEKGANTAYDAEKRFMRYVYPETCQIEKGAEMPDGRRKHVRAFVYDRPIGAIPFTRLRPTDVQRWRDAQLDDDDPEDEEAYGRAKDSINRNLKSLKAAFNYAKDTLKLVSNDFGWKSIKMFKGVGARREGYLNAEKRRELLAVMPGDLRMLAIALLLTGARPGEIANANVNDFDREAGKLALTGKTGYRKITLSDQAYGLFTSLTQGRIGIAPLLVMENGERWTAAVWGRLFRESRERAGMPDAVMYCMRHTYITEAIAHGLNIYTVAEQTGTSVAVIESNYGSQPDDLVERLNKVALL
ncbi:tyrosine-type recombinase/integrase [Burkholderia gladioli]|uniref:tyrosine-type recombinase/integrase n=1 Tax=Burkholderia gladioli TaxID=28095 RepID=UPI00163F5BC0|nr:tyrosine-type recombinase/integrase [Burkholderia gladioli]